MTAKLTLSIDEQVIKKAKLASRRKGKSLSKMVEEYLYTITEKENSKEDPLQEIKKIMQKHKNKIPLPADGNYKKMVREWQYEDYMKKKTK